MRKSSLLFTCLLFFTALAFSAAILSYHPGSETIDTTDIKSDVSEFSRDLDVAGYTADEKPVSVMNMGHTLSSKYLYVLSLGIAADTGYEKINLLTGEVSAVCDIPGCSHKFNVITCKQNYVYQNPVAVGEDIYFVRNNEIIRYDGVDEKEIFKNEYHTAFEEQNYPENPDALFGITVHNDRLYIAGLGHFYIYDMESKYLSDPIDLNLMSASALGFCVTDSKVYYYDISGFLYSENSDGTDAKLIDEGVSAAYSEGDKLFYVKMSESEEMNGSILYKLEDGKEPTAIADNCYVNYCVTDGKIFYQKVNRYDYVTVCDYEGNLLADIHLGSDTESAFDSSMYIKGVNGVSKVYVYDVSDDRKTLYIIDKDTLITDTVKLG